jgi:membrane protease subunit (stomatin/prohibitin family)
MGIRIEVLQFFDNANQSIVERVPSEGSTDVKIGAQLIVQENQEAAFVCDGKVCDTFGPGRYTLHTKNIPIITRLLTIPWEKSPFQAQVYFIGRQTFIDQRWGTSEPIAFRDPTLNIVRLRAFGKYSFRVASSEKFLATLVGTQGRYTTFAVAAYLKDIIVSRLADMLASLKIGLFDLPSQYDRVASETRTKLADDFAKLGLELVDFFINAITPPEEVQKAIDARSSMGVVGDLGTFMRFQAANSLGKISEQGGAGGAMGLGVGTGFGMMMPGMIQQAMANGDRPSHGPSGASFGPDFSQLSAAPSDAKSIVRAVAASAGYAVGELDASLQITVPLGSLRKQILYVDFGQSDSAGHATIQYWSVCGPYNEKNASALLRCNTGTLYGAFAVKKIGEAENVVLQVNQLAEAVIPLEVSRILSAIAWQADAAEQKLVGGDEN